MKIKAGDIIKGTVSNTTEYGAFVDLAPDVTGLIHISALSDDYVRRVTDVVRTGDPVTVEVMNIDERGRYKLRRILPEGEKQKPETEDVEVPQAKLGFEQEPEGQPEPDDQPASVDAEEPAGDADEQQEDDPAQPEFEDRW